MSDCIFCDIVAGKAPASIVYQDDATVAFMDIYHLNQGQVVVIPRQHSPCLSETDEVTGKLLFTTTMRVFKAIRNSGIPSDGNLFLSEGKTAGQDVFHVHFLIVPRITGDSMKITADWKKPDRDELDEIAARIRKAIESLRQ